MNATQLAKIITDGINNGTLPAHLNLTAKALRAGWNVTMATAQETMWILRDNFKLSA